VHRRGHLYWARLPQGKRRPVLVVSPEARNQRASDVIVVPVSTVLRHGPWHVHLRRREGGLPQPSVAKCEQITTLPKDVVDQTPLGGPLSPERMALVERAILRAIGIPVDAGPFSPTHG
jgi:mRNA-degrading endonuclease toxin of MazEF toxin-antitoxin module